MIACDRCIICPPEKPHKTAHLQLTEQQFTAKYRALKRRKVGQMKVLSSLKSAKKRDKNCRVVRRKGRIYVINKTNPRLKARQG